MSQDSLGSIILPPISRTVGDPAGEALENLNTNVLANGVFCYVTEGAGKGGWQLQKEATDAPNGTTIVEPISGPGRWFIKILPGVNSGSGVVLTEGQILYGNIDGTTAPILRPSKVVNALSNFPAPVLGVITLPAFTSWELGASISIEPNRIEMEQGSTLKGAAGGTGISAVSQTGPLISFAPSQPPGATPVTLNNLILTNISGPCFEFDDANGSLLTNGGPIVCVASPSMGRLGALFLASIDTAIVSFGCADGVTIDGAVSDQIEIFAVASIGANPANFTALTITTNFSCNIFALRNVAVNLTDVTTVGLDIDSGATVTRGLVTNAQFFGAGIPLATGAGKVDPGTLTWKFTGNQGIQNSGASAELRFISTTFVTVTVPLVDEWVDLTAVTLTLRDDERFSVDVTDADTLVYVGLDAANITVMATVSGEKAGAGNSNFGITVVKNGLTTAGLTALGTTNPDGHEMLGELNATNIRQIFTPIIFKNIKTGDKFRILIRNRFDADNAEVFAVAFTISS